MLGYDLLRNHAGILRMGHYQTLRGLHDVIHAVNDGSPVIRNKESCFLSLVYDVQKAYEGQRKKIKPPEHYPEVGPRFGVEILWPVLLWQSRVLRQSMAFFDTTKEMHAHAYALEAVIEQALRAALGAAVAEHVIAEWERLDTNPMQSEALLYGRFSLYSAWPKAARKNGLLGMLASLSYQYPVLYQVWTRNGVKHLVSPEEYAECEGAEWHDPRW